MTTSESRLAGYPAASLRLRGLLDSWGGGLLHSLVEGAFGRSGLCFIFFVVGWVFLLPTSLLASEFTTGESGEGFATKCPDYLLRPVSLAERRSEPEWANIRHHGEVIDTLAHEKFGAFAEPGSRRTTFRFFLPNAKRVQVLVSSDQERLFREIDASFHDGGVWEARAEVGPKAKYLLRVTDSSGRAYNRVDPFSLYVEPLEFHHSTGEPTHWVSVVWPREGFFKPVLRRANSSRPVLLEVHPSTYVKGKPNIGIYELVRDHLIRDAKEAGQTHIAFMPLQHRPETANWWGGYKPGAMFSPDYRHGTPDEYRQAFQLLRENGIGVILDFVSGHGTTDIETGLAGIDGTDLYYYDDGRLGFHPEYQSRLYNFTKTHVHSFLLSNARYWLEYYGVDGLRVDCLEIIFYHPKGTHFGHAVQNPGGRHYLMNLTHVVHLTNPDAVMIAEDSTTDHAVTRKRRKEDITGLGFNYRWNFAGQWAVQEAIRLAIDGKPNVRMLASAISEHRVLGPWINMVDNHDTVNALHHHVHPTDFPSWLSLARRDRLRIFLLGTAWQYLAAPGQPMTFQGDAFAQPYGGRGWSDESSLLTREERQNPESQAFLAAHRRLSEVLQREPTLDPQSGHSRNLLVDAYEDDVIVQERHTDAGDSLLVVQNWGQRDFVGRFRYRIPVPRAGKWEIVLDLDGKEFGGTGTPKTVEAAGPPGIYGSVAGLKVDLPRFTTLVLKPVQN